MPLPPGPRALPILGNLLDMPTRRLGPSLRDMAHKYGASLGQRYHRLPPPHPRALTKSLCSLVGDVTYLNILGQPTIILNSFEAAHAILEGRSANTSDRPRIVMTELYAIPCSNPKATSLLINTFKSWVRLAVCGARLHTNVAQESPGVSRRVPPECDSAISADSPATVPSFPSAAARRTR